MSTIARLLELEEGRREKPYLCSEQYPTVGIGKRIGPKGADISLYEFEVSEAIAIAWLDEEIDAVIYTIKKTYSWYNELTQARKDIIVSMCYQLGMTGFSGFRKFIAYMDAGNYEMAGAEMLDSRWAKQTYKRALRHSTVIINGNFGSVQYYKSIEGQSCQSTQSQQY